MQMNNIKGGWVKLRIYTRAGKIGSMRGFISFVMEKTE